MTAEELKVRSWNLALQGDFSSSPLCGGLPATWGVHLWESHFFKAPSPSSAPKLPGPGEGGLFQQPSCGLFLRLGQLAHGALLGLWWNF